MNACPALSSTLCLLASVLVIARESFGQGPSVISPTENLVVQGVPEITASLAQEVRRYTEFRSASFLDWHPTPKQMLISTRFANTMQVHAVKSPGGARSQLTFFDEPVTSASYEPNRGDYFVFRRDVGRSEFWQLYRASSSPVWYLMAKDEGHGFAKKSNVDFQFYSTVTFMRQYLLSDSQ